MPKDGVDWKAEQEYLDSIGLGSPKVVPIGSRPSRDLAELMESFNGPVDELTQRFQETLKAAGYEGTVHLTLQVGVGGRTLSQSLHTTWGKDYENSTRTFEDGLPGLPSFVVNQTVRRWAIYGFGAIGICAMVAGIDTWVGWAGIPVAIGALLFGMVTRPPQET